MGENMNDKRMAHENPVSNLSVKTGRHVGASLPWLLPYSTATSISLAYSGFLDAARMRDGLVVASWGLYLPMDAKSPESLTTVVPEALSCSNELLMIAGSVLC